MMFHSKEQIETHIMKTHEPEKSDEPDRIKQTDTVTNTEKDNSALKECSLCDDTLLTNEEFKSHVSGHLEEIRDIDIEYLKSGHELFACTFCNFESNIPNDIKNHLAEHTLSPKIVSAKNGKTKEEIRALLNTKDWRDAYDEHGNPLYETTDSENSAVEESNDNNSNNDDSEEE